MTQGNIESCMANIKGRNGKWYICRRIATRGFVVQQDVGGPFTIYYCEHHADRAGDYRFTGRLVKEIEMNRAGGEVK